MSSKVWDALKRLYVERVGQNGALSSSGIGASLSRDSRPRVGNISLSNRIKSYNNRLKQLLADEDSVENKFELDRYLLESSEDPDVEDFDILMWWKMNSSRYRVLSQIARDVLAIPVSTVAFKYAFSTRGCVLHSFRSSLSPNTVEALICTQNLLKDAKRKRPLKLRECMDNVEDMDGFEIDTSKIYIYIYICSFCLLYRSIVYLFAQCLRVISF